MRFNNIEAETWANLYATRNGLAIFTEAIKEERDGLEAITDETQAEVMFAESEYQLYDTPEAGIRLDNAYDAHELAMDNYHKAYTMSKDFEQIVELLDKAIDIIKDYVEW